jgi:hypothetical protein
MKMIVESMMECRLAGETEVLGENLPQLTFVHHKIPRAHPGLNPGRRGGKPATNRLSYGAAIKIILIITVIAVRTSKPNLICLFLLLFNINPCSIR